jgi:hypothetical protein
MIYLCKEKEFAEQCCIRFEACDIKKSTALRLKRSFSHSQLGTNYLKDGKDFVTLFIEKRERCNSDGRCANKYELYSKSSRLGSWLQRLERVLTVGDMEQYKLNNH